MDQLVGNTTICTLCICLLLFTVFLNREHLKTDNTNSGTGYLFLLFVSIIYCVFYCPPGGDNATSLIKYQSYFSGVSMENLHFEPIYFKLMDVLPYGYLLWRFVLWGFGCTLMILVFKRFGFNVHLITIGFLAFGLTSLFYYQRACVGYALLYLGCAIITTSHWQSGSLVSFLKNNIWGFLCIAASLPFHSTMSSYVIIALIALILPMDTKSFIATIVLGIVVYLSVDKILPFLLSHSVEDMAKTASIYIEENQVRSSKNLFGIISSIFYPGPVVAMQVYLLYQGLRNPHQFSRVEAFLFKNAYILFLVSLVFGSVSSSVQGKYHVAGLFVWSMLISSYFEHHRNERACRLFVVCCVVGMIVSYGYMILTGTFYDA